ncbi:hypothetical protein ACGFIV_35625 [Sphaerisporangium sp. NPDC049003]|uniref:hypothetical protein n=1 Tax=Sphaerisporangium sp. NPDC049003 TaxID=3364517 RepID=UPI0037204BC8
MHIEACAYLAGLRGVGRAFNTEKTYAGRIALYLSYCLGTVWNMRCGHGDEFGARDAMSAARAAMTSVKDMHRATTFEAGNPHSIARKEFEMMAKAAYAWITTVAGVDRIGPQAVRHENNSLLTQMIADREARIAESAAS